MITVFNRKELFITYSMAELARVRQTLVDNGIDYAVKTRSHGSAYTRARLGSAGLCSDCMYEYVVYVWKTDWERANFLIRNEK